MVKPHSLLKGLHAEHLAGYPPRCRISGERPCPTWSGQPAASWAFALFKKNREARPSPDQRPRQAWTPFRAKPGACWRYPRKLSRRPGARRRS